MYCGAAVQTYGGSVDARRIERAGKRQTEGGDRVDMLVRVWTCGGFYSPDGGFLEFAETH